MVIGAGQRDDLADAKLCNRLFTCTLEFSWVIKCANAKNQALTLHKTRNRVNCADGSGIGDRCSRARKIFDAELSITRLLDQRFIGTPELCKVEIFTSLDRRYEQLAAAIFLCQVNCDTKVDVIWMANCWLTFDLAKEGVHLWHLLHRLDHGEGDDVGK